MALCVSVAVTVPVLCGCVESPVVHCFPHPPSKILLKVSLSMDSLLSKGLFLFFIKINLDVFKLILLDKVESGTCRKGWVQEGLASSGSP